MLPSSSVNAALIAATIPGRSRPIAVTANSGIDRKIRGLDPREGASHPAMSREQILERERRWAGPAAICAAVPLVLYIIALVIEQSAGLAGGNSEAEQLRSLHDHSGSILAASAFRALAFVVLPIPLLYLFRAAQARNP